MWLMDSCKVPQYVDIDFQIIIFLNGQQLTCSLPRLGDSFFLEDEEIILTDDGNYANELLAQPNANKMYSTPLHSQKNVTINKCDQRKFDHFFHERQE